MKITFELDTCEFNDEFIAELFQKLRKPAPAKEAVPAVPQQTVTPKEAVPAVPQQTVAPKAEPQGGYYSVAATTGMEPVKTAPAQPKSSSMAWHWCENLECVEPIQIDHSIYLNTQCCPKCMTSTLHEAKTNTRKGAADERLAFLQKQREAEQVKESEPAKYIICEVAEASKKEPVAAPAPAPAVLSLPVDDTVAVITVKDCIAYAAELRRNNAYILPALKKLLDDFGIPTLNKLPEEQAGIFMQKLRELQ